MTPTVSRVLAWLVACTFALPITASASTCAGLGQAQRYNVWVAGNFSAQSSDVEGRLLAGGNVTINHYSLGDKLDPASAGTSVIVGGDLAFPSGRIHYGNALVRGSASGVGAPVRSGLGAGQTITDRAALPLDIATAHTDLTALSANLASLPANGTYRAQWGGLYLDGDNTSALQVFDLPAQLVLDAHTFEVKKIPTGATVLFTIRGTNAGLKNMSLQTLATIRRRVLFNFPDATRLTLAGISVEGSILAPKATVENPQGVIRGTLIAQSWNGMMQLNHDPFEGCLSSAPANRAPRIVSTPTTITRVDRDYRYQARTEDPDGDSVGFALTSSPAAARIGPSDGLLSWRPQASDIGVHGITLRASDSAGASAEQTYDLRVVQDFCPIYPIAIPQAALEGRAAGSQIEQLPRGTGPGNYSWLSWSGANDAPTLAASLVPPGNSYNYVNPDNANDRVLNLGDWAQGAPGAMNAAAVRNNLDALKNQDIVLPVWGSTRGQGSRFDYRVTRFVNVRLTGYQLNGQGWISFQYKGEAACYNQAPSATAQTLVTDEDTSLPVVLSGTDPDGDVLSYTVLTPPQRGALTGTAPNLVYVPAANFNGDDQFGFRVSDGQSNSAEATIRITVEAVNDQPRATAQDLSVDEDSVLVIALSGADADGEPLSHRIVTPPAHGSLSGTPPQLSYMPTANFHGNDTLHFVANDGQIDSAPALVRILVRPINDAPSASAMALETAEGTALAITLTGNDPDAATLSFELLTQPQHGVLSGTAPNLVYLPTAAFNGSDGFRFRANDGEAYSAAAEVSIVVTAVNDAPVATSQDLAVDEDGVLPLTLSGTDADGDALTFRVIEPTEHGTLSGSPPNLNYTPDADHHGTDTLRFVVNDGETDSAPATISLVVRPINDAPTAAPSSLETAERTALAVTLAGNDIDGDDLAFELLSQPEHGALTGTAPNLVYLPADHFHGNDRLSFRVSDGQAYSAAAEVSIDIVAVNDAPVASSQDLAVDEDGMLPLVLAGTDAEDDALTFRVIERTKHGTLSGSAPTLNYTPDGDYHGTDALRFVVNDGETDSVPATISLVVRPINDLPTATAQSRDTEQDTVLQILLQGADRDNDPLTFRVVTLPTHGTLVGEGANIAYQPEAGFHGDDYFEFVTNDGKADSAAARVGIRVQRNNRAPRINSPPITTASEGQPYRYQVEAIDPEGETLRYSVERAPAALAIGPVSGVIAGTVDPAYVQSVRELNRFCYIAPDDYELAADESVARSPLFQRVRSAITKASDYVAPQTLAWHRYHTCLGCHVQTQALLGLQGSIEKADVDEEAAEYLLSEVLRYQQPDGSILHSQPHFGKTQTVYALWALNRVPDRARTLPARVNALRYFYERRVVDGEGRYVYWTPDYSGGWVYSWQSVTSVIAEAAGQVIREVDAMPDAPQEYRELAQQYRLLFPQMAEVYIAHAQSVDQVTFLIALRLLGMAEIRHFITDSDVKHRLDQAIATTEQQIRIRQGADGGWSYFGWAHESTGDPITSAFVGFALNALGATTDDPAVMRNIEHLLSSQQADGTWREPINRIFNTHLASTGLVMAYLPVALDQFGSPDLILGNIRIDDDSESTSLAIEVTNRGLTDVQIDSIVRAYSGNGPANTPIGTIRVGPLRSAETRWVALELTADPDVGDVYATIEPVAPLDECLTDNNSTHAAAVVVRASDPANLFDTQLFLLNLEDTNAPPQIVSEPITEVAQGAAYDYQVQVNDPDHGDDHEFSLPQTTSGLAIDPISGRIRNAGTEPLAAGTHSVTVRVTDLRGAHAEQRFTLSVAANQPPLISSHPGLVAYVGEEYRYDVIATDPDADTLIYRLDGSPLTMQLDSSAGKVRWTPTTLHRGDHSVAIVVSDNRGGESRQSFVLQVREQRPNRAPAFTSSPATAAIPGDAYAYAATAQDPDGDPLQYSLRRAPSGMTVDADTGLVSWTVPGGATGTVDVELRVTDGRGGEAVQAFTITFDSAGGNRAPLITSTPPNAVVAGELYRYAIAASDPDGDQLAVRLMQGPDGMALNEFTGELRWTPTSAQLGEHAVVVEVDDLRGGVARQPFSVAVNAPQGNVVPVISSTPAHYAKAGREYRYDVVAADANGDSLTYSLTSAPEGMRIDAQTGAIRWLPAFAGRVNATVRVADAGAWVEQGWSIDVAAPETPLAVALNIAPDPVPLGGQFTVTVSISGAAGPTTTTATINGQAVELDADGSTVLTAPNVDGRHLLVVNVDDGFDTVTVSRHFNVGTPSDLDAPTVQIHSPREGAQEELLVLTSPSDVRISVADAELSSWALGLVERGTTSGFIEIARGTAAVDSTIVGQLDPTQLQNGLYTLVLEATDASGNEAQDAVSVSIEGDLKVGHFAISFQDLQVPVAGLPITVTRTYDTRQRHKPLDFGYGWSVDYQSVRIQEARTPGFAWMLKSYATGPLGAIADWCVEPALGNVVSVTMPDGEVEKFRAVASPACNLGVPFLDVELTFEPMPGSHGSLKALDDNFGRLINQSLADADDPSRPLNPSRYLYTNAEGQEFTLHQGFTVREIHEREGGNTVTFGNEGVQHSAGPSITFVRDAQNRITKVIAPDGSELDYQYDAGGNLVAVIDAEENRTTFTYQPGHYLRDIIDPRGVRVSRNEYDDDGRLVAVVDADGQRIEYTRDIDGRTEQVKDRNGNTTTYVYNDRGDVLAETNAEGETTTRTYDSNGNQLSETDAEGNTRRWTYDALGNVLTETDGEGGITRNTYGAFNQLTQSHDANGVLVADYYFRNTMAGGVPVYPGPLVSITDATAAVTGFGYDPASGELNRMTDAAGNVTRYEHDSRGFKVAEIDPLGNRTEFDNDDLGRVLEERRPRTRADGSVELLTTAYTYDANGNVTAVEHPDGSVTTTEYDGNGKPVRECDALQRCTRTRYDSRGNADRVTYPDGTVEAKAFDANGNLVAETDRGGRTTKYVYDKANRLIETILPDDTAGNDADNPRTRSVYDEAGRLVESIDENGNRTAYGYDRAGRRTTTLLPMVNGETAELVDDYDAAGRRIASTDATGVRTEYTYDNAGRLRETRIATTVQSTEYDAIGRKTVDIDPEGRITRYAYDALGRLVTVVLPDPASGANPPLTNGNSPHAGTLSTRYTYDEVGNKLSQTDAEGRTTRWEYDVMGREIARVLPEGQRETKAYNAAGELIAHTDFNGETTRYEYDVTGQLTRIDYPNDADHRFTFDAAGQRTAATDARGQSTHQYDPRGRVLRVADADGGVIEYQYDAANNLVARISPSQSLVYAYDARNRLVEVTRTVDGEAPTTTQYTYDANGRRASMTGGDGIRSEYMYDAPGRLRSLIKRTAASALLMAMTYTVDASGMRTAVEEADSAGTVRSVAYQYDGVKRLTREAIDHREATNDRISTWTYDKVGNRLTQAVTAGTAASSTTTYRYDDNDRLLTETVDGVLTAYAYDANGNTVSKGSPGNLTEYAYDDANRLIEARTPEGTTRYVYNADGLRVRSTHTPTGGTATTTWYLQDSAYPYAQVIEQHAGDNVAQKRLTATYTFADELVGQTRYDADGEPSTSFVQMDGFGSTRWVTDASAAVTDSIDYDAFGVEVARSGSTEVEHLYRGERWDAKLAAYDLRARLYSPGNGRFLTQDSFVGFQGDPASLHKYVYGNSNPALFSDPSGYTGLIDLGVAQRVAVQLVMTTVRSYGFDVVANSFTNALLGTFKSNTNVPKTGNTAAAGLVSAMAVMCKANKKRCLLRGIPTYISGFETPYSTAHGVLAITGNGTTNQQSSEPLPFILVKGLGRDDVDPRRGKPGCQGDVKAFVCDEYPYASTLQGGNNNYRTGRVSLQWVPKNEGNRQGNYLKSFYRKAGLVAGTPAGIFLNVSLPFMPTSFVDRDGDWKKL